jgi:hypothetical protein
MSPLEAFFFNFHLRPSLLLTTKYMTQSYKDRISKHKEAKCKYFVPVTQVKYHDNVVVVARSVFFFFFF